MTDWSEISLRSEEMIENKLNHKTS